jgi:hypothetical protein
MLDAFLRFIGVRHDSDLEHARKVRDDLVTLARRLGDVAAGTRDYKNEYLNYDALRLTGDAAERLRSITYRRLDEVTFYIQALEAAEAFNAAGDLGLVSPDIEMCIHEAFAEANAEIEKNNARP